MFHLRRRFTLAGGTGTLVTGASILGGTETDVLSFDFTDQSILIRDTATPANNIHSAGIVSNGSLIGPGAKLTYTAPSPKLCLQSDGNYKYQAHNLYLNSAAPANQSITVVSGATYAVTITGSVSVTASGAAVATWTAGTNTFTAATGTLTLGSTSGSGTVHIYRTPAVTDYVATAGATLYALPYEWNTSAVCQGIRVEEARTNVCLWSRDLTNAVWTKTNVTAAKDQTGIDGVANSASKITATAGNGTCLQAITLASSARYQSAFVKRITGSGTINMTLDAGLTWTPVTVTASWTRVEIPTQTLANPTVGFQIVTSGDAIAVDVSQNENGTFATSPIETFASTVTRAADSIYILTSLFPVSSTTQTVFRSMKHLNNIQPTSTVLSDNSYTNYVELRYIQFSAGVYSSSGTAATVTGGWDSQSGLVSKAAIAYNATNKVVCFNGTVGGSPGTAPTFGSFTRLLLASTAPNETAASNQHYIQKVLAAPRRYLDAELATITT